VVDAIVIGSGPNGLVAANLLADAGWDVLVLEAQADAGGAVRSGELTLPGFVHDRFSSFYPLGLASPVMQGLDLEAHGVRWRQPEIALAHPAPDGTAALLSRDLEATCASLEALGRGDGEAFRRWMAYWDRISGPLLDALFTPFPPVRGAARLAGVLGPRGLLELTRFGVMPVRRWAEEEFAGEGAARLFAGNALHADLNPESPGSALYGMVLCGLGHQVGFPVPEGGSGRLSDALVRRLRGAGGDVECGARVTRVELRGGRAAAVRTADGRRFAVRRAVLADVGAPQLYEDLVGLEHLPDRVRHGLERFQYDNSTFKVDWALSGPVPWQAPGVDRAGTIHVTPGLDALTEAMAQIDRRLVPERPFLIAGQYDTFDSTRAPEGCATFWGYTHVPREVRGDAGDDGLTGDWEDPREREAFTRRIEDQVEAVAPGFRARILDRHVTSPLELEAADANLVKGAINGGTAQLHQQLVLRPVPGLGRAETPVPGLYLASASAHPGGGVHGACGANAARAALRTRPVSMLRRPVQRLRRG
jgi:phytoene dehydrogenase-like protein